MRSARAAALTAALACAVASSCTNPNATVVTTLPPIASGTGPLLQPPSETTQPPTTPPPRKGASVDDTAPLSNPDFATEIEADGTIARTMPIGLVGIPLREGSQADGTCLALLGTFNALSTRDLLVTPGALGNADIGVGGKPIPADQSPDCDRSDLDDAGWGTRADARLLPGASFNFAMTFFLPSGSPNPSYVRIFGTTNSGADTYYDPAILGGPPSLPSIRPGAAPLNLYAADPDATTPFPIGDNFQTFDAIVRGFVGGISRTDGRPGECLAVLGTIEPTKTIGAIMNSLAVPAVNLIVDGVALPPSRDRCEQSPLVERGWFGLEHAGVAVGNTFAFVQTFPVPSDQALVQAIVVGDLYERDQRRAIEPLPMPEIPEAPIRSGKNPSVDLRMVARTMKGTLSAPETTVPPEGGTNDSPIGTGTTAPTGSTTSTSVAPDTSTVRDESIRVLNEAVWNANVYGLVRLPSNADGATCYGVLMSWWVSDGTPTDPPPVGIIAGGAYWAPGETAATCDTSSLINAGWVNGLEANFNDVDESVVQTFIPIFIPDGQGDLGAIGIGNVADDENVAYVEPAILSGPPSS